MTTGQQVQGKLDITPEDIQALCQTNPLAAEQLRNIVLQRSLAAKDAQIAKLSATNGHIEEADTSTPQ